jgi:hypothetical protein
MEAAKAKFGVLMLASICAWAAWASQARAQQTDNPLKAAAKLLGFATDVAPPADFVLKSRPAGDLDYIPVFQPPPEPEKPPLKDTDLKAMRGDLDSVQKRDDSVRQAFPPAAKAMAEDAAAQKAKAQAKAKPAAPNQ